MNRKQYIANDTLALVEYCNDQDVKAEYDCWHCSIALMPLGWIKFMQAAMRAI